MFVHEWLYYREITRDTPEHRVATFLSQLREKSATTVQQDGEKETQQVRFRRNESIYVPHKDILCFSSSDYLTCTYNSTWCGVLVISCTM